MADESVYPGILDGDLRLLVPGSTTPAGFEDFLQLVADAVSKIETELGVDPAGAAATVRARLDAIITTTQAAFVADAAALTSTDTTSPNASDLATAITLANELKGDFNALRADVTALRATVNNILAALRGANKPMATA